MIQLTAQPLTAEAFAPFGELILPTVGGDGVEVALDLSQGTPRYNVMRLTGRAMRFGAIAPDARGDAPEPEWKSYSIFADTRPKRGA